MPGKAAAREAAVSIAPIAEDPFSVHVTGPAERARRSLKYNDTFLVIDSHGDIGASAGGPDGLFHTDTRFLSRLELLIGGMPLLLLGSNLRDDNSLLSVDLTNPDIWRGGRIVLPQNTLHIDRTIFIWQDVAHQRIGVHNFGTRPLTMELVLKFECDFADLFEVRGATRNQRGTSRVEIVADNEILCEYRGLDKAIRRTTLHFEPKPTGLNANEATFRFNVKAGEHTSLFATVTCGRPTQSAKVPFIRALLAVRREMRAAKVGVGSIATSNPVFNEIVDRAMADLCMLKTETPQGDYPYAGIPWYSTTFGRDGLITALQMLWLDPSIARGVLRRLAAFQAKSDDPHADAQPGKILHEMRGGEMAALGEVPFQLYYGSVDATPLFVLLAGLYVERTGDDRTLGELWPAIEAALHWIDGPGDPDRDGFVEYRRLASQGLNNQGWKDSEDAIFHADGRLAEGNIALAEVQGYVFAAKRLAACCARRLGFTDRATALEADSVRLAEQFESAFWSPEMETYAMALDGMKEPCLVRSSNAGQVLFSGIARPDRAAQVARGLMQAYSFSGWGIRTIAKGEARFNPMSYHNGSIWPHDNAMVALGFARYGFKEAVIRVFNGLFDAATYMDLRRLPELFCGFQREHQHGPTLYPVACVPQAWASVAPFALLGAALGLEFDAPSNVLRLREPWLPSFLNEISITDLRFGDSSIDLKVCRRSDNKISLETVNSSGTAQVMLVATQ